MEDIDAISRIELRREKERKVIGPIPKILVLWGYIIIILIMILLILAVTLLPYPNGEGEKILQHILYS